jgi:hypothetical protein
MTPSTRRAYSACSAFIDRRTYLFYPLFAEEPWDKSLTTKDF